MNVFDHVPDVGRKFGDCVDDPVSQFASAKIQITLGEVVRRVLHEGRHEVLAPEARLESTTVGNVNSQKGRSAI